MNTHDQWGQLLVCYGLDRKRLHKGETPLLHYSWPQPFPAPMTGLCGKKLSIRQVSPSPMLTSHWFSNLCPTCEERAFLAQRLESEARGM